MPIHTKKASKEWIKAFEQFERTSGFEIMSQESIDYGSMTCQQVWDLNVRLLEDALHDVINIKTPLELE